MCFLHSIKKKDDICTHAFEIMQKVSFLCKKTTTIKQKGTQESCFEFMSSYEKNSFRDSLYVNSPLTPVWIIMYMLLKRDRKYLIKSGDWCPWQPMSLIFHATLNITIAVILTRVKPVWMCMLFTFKVSVSSVNLKHLYY